MYEHPHLAYTVMQSQQAEIQQAVDRRRILAEHADQIVPRPAGPLVRLGRRMLRAADAFRAVPSDPPAVDARNAVARSSGVACEPASAR